MKGNLPPGHPAECSAAEAASRRPALVFDILTLALTFPSHGWPGKSKSLNRATDWILPPSGGRAERPHKKGFRKSRRKGNTLAFPTYCQFRRIRRRSLSDQQDKG